ncbi:hypothetical protein [Brevibacillus brevis]|uniref:hypothetical protein n=1 Tax=Brevibacillus brevis TaxID=1393 RepID=UPI0037C99E09
MNKRIATLSTVLGVLALSTLLAIAAEDNNVSPLSGDDYGIELYASNIHDVTRSSAYLWAYTQGEGKDLAKTRVYSYFFVNGKLKHKDYDNGRDYANIGYEVDVKELISCEIRSSHYAYNKMNEVVTETSKKEWPE